MRIPEAARRNKAEQRRSGAAALIEREAARIATQEAQARALAQELGATEEELAQCLEEIRDPAFRADPFANLRYVVSRRS